MSEEEKKAIEILKDNIGILEGKLTIKYTNYNTVKAYNTILNLIEKQQKEIEELKQRNMDLTEAIEEWVNGERINDIKHISKDKIREKIKKEEKYQETTKKLFPDSLNYHMQKYAVDVLNELLED